MPALRPIRNPQSAIRNSSGIALVITLLMLSVITFLAVAFLILTRGHRDAVSATLDVETAKSMSQAALARSQTEIISRMMAHHDFLIYDYMASHNFINAGGFTNNVVGYNPNNVNYDFDSTGAAMSPSANPQGWAQNINNLLFDPRPPVFIKTTSIPNFPADFRFWVDVNRNGKFEANGDLAVIGANGQPVVNPTNSSMFVTNFFDGEPEWIGMLQYPEYPHSATNRFIGRYAFLVQPMGKMLDFNYIHNYSKSLVGGPVTANMPAVPVTSSGVGYDGFLRDQGVGSWELNLAGFLWGLNSDLYDIPAAPSTYNYINGVNANTGLAFDDAYSFLRFRYAAAYGNPNPGSLFSFFGPTTPNPVSDQIDEYGTAAISPSYSVNNPWPGGYATNHEYNIQDVFNTNKTSLAFVNRLLDAGAVVDSYDRYTFQRLLAGIGTGSEPELQTYVYADGITNLPNTPQTRLRTKININYDNTPEIVNGLNTSPPVLVPWTQEAGGALGFFTNAAESLLRSQDFRITNYEYTTSNGIPVLIPTNLAYMHFGLTNIPIYNSTNPSIRYTEQLHRMLQLAANIYDATRTNTVVPAGSLPYPSVFRPIFFATNNGISRSIYITGYVQVTTDALNQMSKPFVDFADSLDFNPNGNLWGIPWVVGTVKGLPAFDRYVSDTSWMVTRKLLFTRKPGAVPSLGDPNKTPANTNQFFIMSVTNVSGLDAWNTYGANVQVPFQIVASNFVSITLASNAVGFPLVFATNFSSVANYSNTFWRGYGSLANPNMTNGMLGFLQTNIAALPPAYFSQTARSFLPVSADVNIPGFNLGNLVTTNGAFQPADLVQTSWPVYDWVLTVTNRVMYALLDSSGQAFDFVNLGPFGVSLNLTNILYAGTIPSHALAGGSGSTSADNSYWIPGSAGIGLPSIGLQNQITNGVQNDPYFASELAGTAPSKGTINSNLFFSCSNDVAATVFAGFTNTLLVNDPLVHYTVGDLMPPVARSATPILTDNERYEPWPTPSHPGDANMTLEDPLIYSSDYWDFPTNRFPSIGWLGRVHRGTPWQTIFLKADPVTIVNGVNENMNTWVSSWVSTLDTYPTTDYPLLDLFTAAPNDNASRGLLSVNQTNAAPWYAVFSGLAVNTNIANPLYRPAPVVGPDMVLDPSVLATLITNIYAARTNQPDQVFHNIGSIFSAPGLSVESPYLPAAAGNFTDEEVEAIPQQVAGLLKLGRPQFVIYSWGQSLKPKDIYFGSQANLFNLCTNYQITGEYLTRTVCHVVGDPSASNLKIQVDSFNVLPAD